MYPGTDPESYITEYTRVYKGSNGLAIPHISGTLLVSAFEHYRVTSWLCLSKTPGPAERISDPEVYQPNPKGFLCVIDSGLGGVPWEQKMLEGHLPRVIYHRVYKFAKIQTGLAIQHISNGKSIVKGQLKCFCGEPRHNQAEVNFI